MHTFDDVVVGAGQAGPFLAARLAEAGRKVALIEQRRLGGTCVNDGCIPTKTLIASARAAYVAREAARWGVETGPVRVDYARVKARKDAVVNESRAGLETWLGGLSRLTQLHGSARFTSPTTLDVGGQVVTGERFFVNVGARPVLPDTPGLAAVAMTNTEMMELTEAPEHLVILGGSFIGLEFGQAFRRFGSRVTVLERGPRLLPREDDDVVAVVQAALAREGVTLRTGVVVERVERVGQAVRLFLADGTVVEGSHLLAAVGRLPNSDRLDLGTAGVVTDARGFIVVDDALRTSVPHIWALGDVNGRGAFTHTSYNDFEVVAANLLEGQQRSIAKRPFVAAVYVDPPVGRVGWSEREALASGRPVLKGVRPMTRVGRARERGETDGFMKVLVDAETDALLGATLVGIEADEAIHVLATAMTLGATATSLRQCVFAHPTVSELIPTVLGSLTPLR
jgi:pyruvate/2-oxoglutarate dehydrogenase complex dihydrolipoamide dehydrogenase (E3) component